MGKKQITKPSSERRLKVFLCHASEDKPRVRRLHQRLCKVANLDAWLDDINLLPGQDWDQKIQSAIRASNVVIICLSRNSIAKEGYVQKEMREALEVAKEKPPGTIYILPARIDDCEVPPHFRKFQYATVFTKKGYAKLEHALRARAELLGIAIGAPIITTLKPGAVAPSGAPEPTCESQIEAFLSETRRISSISDPSLRVQAAFDAASKFQSHGLRDNWENSWESLYECASRSAVVKLNAKDMYVLGCIPESYLPGVIESANGITRLDSFAFFRAFGNALHDGCSIFQLVKTMGSYPML
jgi:hypothetical protein